jgi:hypothetical protein
MSSKSKSTTIKLSTRKSKKSMRGGESIPLFTTTSPDWHDADQKAPLAVDLNVGINEYQFGRTTPDNKFVESTGVVNTPNCVEMVGGKKSKKSSSKMLSTKKRMTQKSSSTKKKMSKKPSSTKKPKSIINKIVSGSKNLFERTKKMLVGEKKKVVKKKSKKTKKSEKK